MKWEIAAVVCAIVHGQIAAAERAGGYSEARALAGVGLLIAALTLVVVGLVA